MSEGIKYVFVGIGIGTAVMGLWVLYCLSQFNKKGVTMKRYYWCRGETTIYNGLKRVWGSCWLTPWEKVKLTLMPRIRGKR